MNVRICVWVGILAMAFPIAAVASFGAKTSVADYRWRNDDGGESAASWKADPHTAITGVKRDTNIRLRMALVSNAKITATNSVQYATSTNGPWTAITTQIGRPFRITSTAWYADGDPTTAQIPIGTGKTFMPGRCVESPSSSVVVSLASSNESTEVEFCFQATAYAARNTTYYFIGGAQLTIEDTDPTTPPTDFYVDDSDSGKAIIIGGSASSNLVASSYTSGAWMGACGYLYPSKDETTDLWFRWIPDLPNTAEYNVYARWTDAPSRGRNVPYKIQHAGGTSPEVFVNQRDPALAGRWNLLGTFTFNAGTNGWVQMGGNDGQACVDAVWLQQVGGAPLADADGDGMLDTWESTYLGGTSASPTADADLDGMSNLQEFQAGTIPNNSKSVLAVVGLTGSGQNLDLKWLSADGKTYEIQKSTNLTQGFPLTEASAIPANPPTNSYSVTLGASGSGFYRVRLE